LHVISNNDIKLLAVDVEHRTGLGSIARLVISFDRLRTLVRVGMARNKLGQVHTNFPS